MVAEVVLGMPGTTPVDPEALEGARSALALTQNQQTVVLRPAARETLAGVIHRVPHVRRGVAVVPEVRVRPVPAGSLATVVLADLYR